MSDHLRATRTPPVEEDHRQTLVYSTGGEERQPVQRGLPVPTPPEREQPTLIDYDKIKETPRYFHVSVQLDNTDDHKGASGEIVKFYRYGDNFHCGLGEIEGLTKALIKKICEV